MVYGSQSRVTKRSAADLPGGGGGQHPVRTGKSRAEHRRGVVGEGARRQHPAGPRGGTGMRQAAGRRAEEPLRAPHPGPAGQGGGRGGGQPSRSRGNPCNFPPRGGICSSQEEEKNIYLYIHKI